MKSINFIKIERFYFLCRQTLGKERNEFFSICIKIIALFILATVLFGFIGISSYAVASPFFYLIFYFGGIRMAASAFPELRNTERSSFWLMIPGSTLEKYLSRLILTSLGFAVLFSLLFFIGVNVGNIINTLFFKSYFFIFIPFARADFLSVAASFLILHSIFFAGGLFFKRYPIIKTILFVLMLILLFMIGVSIIGGIVFSYRVSFNVENFPVVSRYWALSVSLFYKIICYCIIPLFCWIIGYQRLKEVEVY